MALYSRADVLRPYSWLGHGSVTEVSALHPAYRPCDSAWNRAHDSYPVIAYVASASELERFVARYAGERLVCLGINPRPRVLGNERGFVRSARHRMSPQIGPLCALIFEVPDEHVLGRGARTPWAARSSVLVLGNQKEQLAAAVRYLRIGLDRGERCVYIADENSADVVLAALRPDGIGVDNVYPSPWHVGSTNGFCLARSGIKTAPHRFRCSEGLSIH